MRIILLIIFWALSNTSYSQDKETRAQSAYMAAETAYNEGDYTKAVQKLSDATTLLGKSNAKIEYLMVKSLVEQKKYAAAQEAIGKYFEYAANNKGTEKYTEMVKLLSELEDKAEVEKLSGVINSFWDELKKAMPNDNEYVYLHSAIKRFYGSEDTFKDSCAVRRNERLKSFKERKSKTQPYEQF